MQSPVPAEPPTHTTRPTRNGPYGHRAIWAIALPMIVSASTTPLVGLVGTGVVGHLEHERYLAGVAAGAQIFSVVFIGLNFLRMGTTGLTAQAHGARNPAGVRAALGEATVVALLLGMAIILLQRPLLAAALALLGPDSGVAPFTRQYYGIRVWSAPAALFNFVAIGWLLGMQNARGPLAITLTINVTNVVLDLWFVLGLGLQVRGVAAGSLLAEYTGAGLALWLVRRELATRPGRWDGARLWRPASYARLFHVNGNLFVRTLALMFTFGFVTAQGARMGGLYLAVNALLMNFQYLLAYVLDGIANAAEALVGHAVGQRDRQGLKTVVRRTLGWSVLLAGLFTLAFAAGGSWLIRLLTDLPAVRATAQAFLPWLLLSPLISVWSFLYDGVYVGATRSREMCVVMVVAALGVFLPAWFFFRDLGNHGLWLAFTLFMAARGLGMHLWFRRLVEDDVLVRAP